MARRQLFFGEFHMPNSQISRFSIVATSIINYAARDFAQPRFVTGVDYYRRALPFMLSFTDRLMLASYDSRG